MTVCCLIFHQPAMPIRKYKRIGEPAYRVGENGYLHFTAEYAGDIIISDGPLEKQQ